ncbi:DUF6415 family natural product biosynthesis protein [Streptomyces sp. SCSIO 30461]|uniref:DUF6415 family natural product biosynthesis protein n=1 Tax=Streptomyces sp. SCSIO 30461 TaxID=3118085 RepID=UPI0030D3C81E
MEAQGLLHLLDKVREWTPVDWDAVYDGLDTVLNSEVSHHAAGIGTRDERGATPPEYDDAEDLTQRFREALMQLVNRGLRAGVDTAHPDIANLIEEARALRTQEIPGDRWEALAFLRRLGRVTLALAERLEETGTVKGLAAC